jgi:pimeloyl-ACP methyl ester carboxylesterase
LALRVAVFFWLRERGIDMLDPMLSIGGEKSLGNELAAQMKLVADNVTIVVLPNTGHWILEERPKETIDALIKLL